ncbi:hypothetical protein FKM82_020580 [Ascaphus truei]
MSRASPFCLALNCAPISTCSTVFPCLLEIIRGPTRSIATCWKGSPIIGRGFRGAFTWSPALPTRWQASQERQKVPTSRDAPGQ